MDVGIPILSRFTTVVQHKRIERQREVVKTVVERAVEKKIILKQVAIVFDQQVVNFVTGNAELLPVSLQKLERLAKFLTANKQLWSKMMIEGHTDRRGTPEYNMKLSQDRAVAVGQTLLRFGVESSRLTWQGFGFTRPLDPQENPLAWARNRRVELRFEGVSDDVALKSGVDRAMAGQ
jgi:outer membrane protein OmpA-like peptidoglycan-associated protein